MCEKVKHVNRQTMIDYYTSPDKTVVSVMQWYSGGDGIVRDSPYNTCRHRELYPPVKDDPTLWDISFPDSP